MSENLSGGGVGHTVETGYLVGSGLTALLAQKGYIVPKVIQNLFISSMNVIKDFFGITLKIS